MNSCAARNYTVFETAFGWVGLGGSAAGLRHVTLPVSSRETAYRQLALDSPEATSGPAFFGDLPQRLERYFAGEPVVFDDRLDFAGAPAFTKTVWEMTRLIPYGQTKTYAWVAQQIGKPLAPRAVGQALARNPFAIIVPCHRVVGHNGNLVGFAAGIEMKKRLLALEARRRL